MNCVILVLFCILHQLSRCFTSPEYSDMGPMEEQSCEFCINMEAKTKSLKSNSQYKAEKAAGSMADLFGINEHYKNPTEYTDFGRRYAKHSLHKQNNILKLGKNDELVPVKAPPEMVMAVAAESALLEAAEPNNPTDELIKNEILRTGDYWNAVWKEDVDPKTLRTYINRYAENSIKDHSKLESIKARIMPGTKMYQLISALQRVSPKFLYVINEKQ